MSGLWQVDNLVDSAGTGPVGASLGIKAKTNGAAQVGAIGELRIARVTSQTPVGATGVYFDLVSLPLQPGDWEITALAVFDSNGATVTSLELAISTVPNQLPIPRDIGDNTIFPPAMFGGESTGQIACYPVTILIPTTYYLEGFAAYTVATPQYRCRFQARRTAAAG